MENEMDVSYGFWNLDFYLFSIQACCYMPSSKSISVDLYSVFVVYLLILPLSTFILFLQPFHGHELHTLQETTSEFPNGFSVTIYNDDL